MTIISPKQQIKQFELQLNPDKGILPQFQIHYNEIPLKTENSNLVNETIAYYQSASYILKKKEYQFKDLADKNKKLYANVRP